MESSVIPGITGHQQLTGHGKIRELEIKLGHIIIIFKHKTKMGLQIPTTAALAVKDSCFFPPVA